MSRADRGRWVFDDSGNLPAGTYGISLAELGERFAWNGGRRTLVTGLRRALSNLADAGVRRVWVDGSFVTAKEEPNDVDGCWEYGPWVDEGKLDEVFLDLAPPREAMKQKYGVDFLISGAPLLSGGRQTVEEFFQFDRDGNRKGILLIELGEEA